VTEPLERIAELERRIARLEEALRNRNSREQKLAAEEMLSVEGSPPTSESAIPLRRVVMPTPTGAEAISRMPKFSDPPVAAKPKRDWEGLIGRYGTLVLATITALVGVGTFVGWAISKGLLSPGVRVGLGLVIAAALAIWGLRLRRTERSYGASILGLALAITHVCAWGMGPTLHLVPVSVAFALVAAASLALEYFAHREDDEALWSVGFFGAALAPFVTSDGSGNLFQLAAYGVGVLVSSGFVLGERPWRVAGRLFIIASGLYVVALATGFESRLGPVLAAVLPIAVAFLGVLRWTTGTKRRHRLRWLGAMAAAAALRVGVASGLPMSRPLTASLLAALGIGWVALVAMTHVVSDADQDTWSDEGGRVDAGVIPMVFVGAILLALDSWMAGGGSVLAAMTAFLLATVGLYPAGGLRQGAVLATMAAAVGSVIAIADPHFYVATAGISIVGAGALLGNRWKPTMYWVASAMMLFAFTMIQSLGYLGDLVAFAQPPFSTPATAVAATVLAAMYAAWRLGSELDSAAVFFGGTLAWAFVWVHQEIAIAFNPTAATLLRVSYYALTSVAAVWTGKSRNVAGFRHVGLGLAVIAALYALFRAQDLSFVGARIAADLVAAVFLLAIAYWYRKPGPEPTAPLSPV